MLWTQSDYFSLILQTETVLSTAGKTMTADNKFTEYCLKSSNCLLKIKVMRSVLVGLAGWTNMILAEQY